jgi:membrane protein CcdC involved in cytochrome C biogenesis
LEDGDLFQKLGLWGMLKSIHQSTEWNLYARAMSLCRYQKGIWTKHRAVNYGRLRFELTWVETTKPIYITHKANGTQHRQQIELHAIYAVQTQVKERGNDFADSLNHGCIGRLPYVTVMMWFVVVVDSLLAIYYSYQAMEKQRQYNSLYQQSNTNAQRQKKALQDSETGHQLKIEPLMTSVDMRSTLGHLQSLFGRYAPFRGKWKIIVTELLNLDVLKDILIDQSVFHIKNNVYIKTSRAYAVDMYHVVNLSGIYNARKIEASSNCRCLLWSSGPVKDLHHHIEKEMQKEIKFDIINDIGGDTIIDGIKFKM